MLVARHITPARALATALRATKPASPSCRRFFASKSPYDRPSPPPLPAAEQREFEELVRRAQTPLSAAEEDLAMHPDARAPLQPEFEGDINPVTGEQGGPKREPVRRWTEEGDWSYKGRVSDF